MYQLSKDKIWEFWLIQSIIGEWVAIINCDHFSTIYLIISTTFNWLAGDKADSI